MSICTSDIRDLFFSQKLKSELQGYRSDLTFERLLEGKEFSDSMRTIQYLDFKTYLPGDILTKVDRASMANSLEVRVPFLDHTFVEWASSLPTSIKLKGSEGKYVLKKALEPHLPRAVLYRQKMGFAVPIENWFRHSIKDKLRATVTSECLIDSGFFDRKQVTTLVDQHISGKRNHSPILWALLMFEGLLRRC